MAVSLCDGRVTSFEDDVWRMRHEPEAKPRSTVSEALLAAVSGDPELPEEGECTASAESMGTDALFHARDVAMEAVAAREALRTLKHDSFSHAPSMRTAAVLAQAQRVERNVAICLSSLRTARGSLPAECFHALVACAHHLCSPDCETDDTSAFRALFDRTCFPHSHNKTHQPHQQR